MIDVMTFEEFEEKFQINIKTMAPELLSQSKDIMFSLGEYVSGSIFTRAIQSKGHEKELEEIKNFYKSGFGIKRPTINPSLGLIKPILNVENSLNCTIVYQKLAIKDTGIIKWSFYKLVVFNTTDIVKIKKLLKIHKLKVFL